MYDLQFKTMINEIIMNNHIRKDRYCNNNEPHWHNCFMSVANTEGSQGSVFLIEKTRLITNYNYICKDKNYNRKGNNIFSNKISIQKHLYILFYQKRIIYY
jgi:hypothetical protein